MKKMTSCLSLMAASAVLFAGVYSASALQLKAVSPTLNPETGGGGHPTWFQDQNSIAIQPPIAPATGFPDILPATGFPGVLPGNIGPVFPPEFFYYMLQSATVPMGNTDVDVLFALEASWIDQQGNLVPLGGPAAVTNPILLPLKAVVFQRMRMRVKPTGPLTPGAPINTFASGDYRIDHPWGTTIFTCVGPGGNNSACQETTDIVTAGDGVFTAALGFAPPNAGLFFGFDKFAKATTAIAPALGDGVTSGPIISAGITPLLSNNVVITPPAGGGAITTISNFIVVGKTIGLEISPPGVTDFGIVKPLAAGAVGVTRTININNLSGALVSPLVITAINPSSIPAGGLSPDFTIVPSALSLTPCALGVGATLAIGARCDFDVLFNPATLPDGVKTSTITITGGGTVPPAQAMVTGISDSILPNVVIAEPTNNLFTNTSTPLLTFSATDANPVTNVVSVVTGVATAVVPTVSGGNLPSQLDGQHTVIVNSTDAAGNVASASNVFTVDTVKPTAAITAPLNGILTPNNSPTLTFNVVDANPSIATVTVNNGVNTFGPAPFPALLANSLPLGLLADGLYTVVVAVNDKAANVSAPVSTSFTVDATAPVIMPSTFPVITAALTIGVTAPAMTFPLIEANTDVTKTVVTLNRLSGNPILTPITTLSPNSVITVQLPVLNVGELNTLTIDTTDLASNLALTKTVTFTLLLNDGSIATLGATPPTIDDVILALKAVLNGTLVPGVTPPFPEAADITPASTVPAVPASDKFLHGDVSSHVAGKLVLGPDGIIDIGDVLTILKKVVGITTF